METPDFPLHFLSIKKQCIKFIHSYVSVNHFCFPSCSTSTFFNILPISVGCKAPYEVNVVFISECPRFWLIALKNSGRCFSAHFAIVCRKLCGRRYSIPWEMKAFLKIFRIVVLDFIPSFFRFSSSKLHWLNWVGIVGKNGFLSLNPKPY